MGYFERLTPRSITAQITGIVVVSVLLGMVLTAAIVLFSGAAMPNDSPTAVALRIAHVTRFVRAARSLADADTILTAAQNAGVVVERVAISDLETLPNDAGLEKFVDWTSAAATPDPLKAPVSVVARSLASDRSNSAMHCRCRLSPAHASLRAARMRSKLRRRSRRSRRGSELASSTKPRSTRPTAPAVRPNAAWD